MNEREMLDRLAVRYGKTYRNGDYIGREFARAEHVPDGMGWNSSRIADFLAVRFFKSMGFEHIKNYREQSAAWAAAGRPPRTNTLIGHEVKVSRADWLSELRSPDKAEAWKQYCHGWYLVVSDLGIVQEHELPQDWGLMVKHGRSVRIAKQAPRLQPLPLPFEQVAALSRAIMKTEVRHALQAAESSPLHDQESVPGLAVRELGS